MTSLEQKKIKTFNEILKLYNICGGIHFYDQQNKMLSYSEQRDNKIVEIINEFLNNQFIKEK